MDENEVLNQNDHEEESIYFCFSASLRIFGDIEDLDEITKVLGVKPTLSYVKGQPKSKRTPKVCWKHDAWIYNSPVPEDRPLDIHIQKLWEIMKPHRQYLLDLKKKLTVDVFCGYRSNCDCAGFEVSASSLEMFVSLEIPFGVSVIIA